MYDFHDLMRKMAATPAKPMKRTTRVEELMAVAPYLHEAINLMIKDGAHVVEAQRAEDAIVVLATHLPWLRWTKREQMKIENPDEPYVGYSSAPYAAASKSSNTSKIAAMALKGSVLTKDRQMLLVLSDIGRPGCTSTEACVIRGDKHFTFSETYAGSMSRLAGKGLACDTGERRPSLKPNHDGSPRKNPGPTTVWAITEKGEDQLAMWLGKLALKGLISK